MARPIKNTVDYFPHIIQNGKTIFILESKYGNDGYAFWFKLLELLGLSHNHVYDYGNLSDWEFLIAKTKVSEDKANSILKTLADVGAIDSELLEKKIIWCENFVKGVEDVYKKRKQDRPKKPLLIPETPKKLVLDTRNPITPIVSTDENFPPPTTPPLKLNKTKLKDIKEEIKEVPINLFREKEERDQKNRMIYSNIIKKHQLIESVKEKPNNIEFDFEMWSWHGIDDDIMDRWAKIFPTVEVTLELVKMREYFKKHPGHEKMIKEKFRGNYANYIFDWLERAKRYKEKDNELIKKEGR